MPKYDKKPFILITFGLLVIVAVGGILILQSSKQSTTDDATEAQIGETANMPDSCGVITDELEQDMCYVNRYIDLAVNKDEFIYRRTAGLPNI